MDRCKQCGGARVRLEDGIREGKGKLTWADGSCYKGALNLEQVDSTWKTKGATANIMDSRTMLRVDIGSILRPLLSPCTRSMSFGLPSNIDRSSSSPKASNVPQNGPLVVESSS